MQVTVKAIKTDWQKPVYSLEIDGIPHDWSPDASKILTRSSGYGGIFTASIGIIPFTRDDATVIVDFGDPWDPSEYSNPALEIQRRVALVDETFELVRESYQRSFTVTL